MRFSKLLLPILLAYTVTYPVVAQTKPIVCPFQKGDISKITKVISIKNMGITITVPSNFRAVALNNGSVTIVDAATYKLLNCLANNPGAVAGGGSEYLSLVISKSKMIDVNVDKGNYRNLEDNKILSWTRIESNYYNIKLLVLTNQGLIEVESPTEGPVSSDSEIKEQVDSLITIANSINII